MPWIDKEACTGCGICIDKCPADAILLHETEADIDMDDCIRCALCHDICPVDAVKHDSDRVDEWIDDIVRIGERNRDMTTKLLGNPDEGKKSLGRTIKSYKRSAMIYRMAAERLEELHNRL